MILDNPVIRAGWTIKAAVLGTFIFFCCYIYWIGMMMNGTEVVAGLRVFCLCGTAFFVGWFVVNFSWSAALFYAAMCLGFLNFHHLPLKDGVAYVCENFSEQMDEQNKKVCNEQVLPDIKEKKKRDEIREMCKEEKMFSQFKDLCNKLKVD